MSKLKNQRLKQCRRYLRFLGKLELQAMPTDAKRWSLDARYDWWWSNVNRNGEVQGADYTVPWSIVYRQQGFPARSYRF